MTLIWHNVRDWGVEGKAWSDTEQYYDRLPARAHGVVRPPVWDLSRHSTGMCARFSTDSPSIHCRWSVGSASLAMTHMPATGVSGVDLYARTDSGDWQWLAVGQPANGTEFTSQLIAGIDPGEREYRLYLPLYNSCLSVEIGVEEGANFTPLMPRTEGALVFYGTSIVHGGCASRPGMTHAAILGRRLNVPIINLGFSGNGTMDLEIGTLLAELDPVSYIIDCLPNMDHNQVATRTEPLVHTLRQAHPTTPIVLVEDRTFGNAPLISAQRHNHALRRAALRTAYDHLVQAGDTQLYYVDGESLLGNGSEGTVDGSHPTDLGFMRQADALTPVLAPLVHGGRL